MQACFGLGGGGGHGVRQITSAPNTTRYSDTFLGPPRSDVIPDLDLYFVRQIAQSLQEYDLEQKINLELRMREGTARLLAACKHPLQALEASKSLLTSTERMAAYMAELQRRKAAKRKGDSRHTTLASTILEPCKAKLAVSDLRIPLIWKDTDHFKNRGDCRRFAVFCLFKIGSQVLDTVLYDDVDRRMTDISFDDVLVFSEVPGDFECQMEVYAHLLQDDLSIASASHRLRRKISNSVSKTIGRKLAANMKDDVNSPEISKFRLVARAKLGLADSGDDIRTHDLVIESVDDPACQLPLFGHFCCRLAAQAEFALEERISGQLSLIQKVSNAFSCRRIWASLMGNKLQIRQASRDESPMLVFPINKDSAIRKDGASGFPRSFQLVTPVPGSKRELNLAAETEEDLRAWMNVLTQHIKDIGCWGIAMEGIVEIPSPTLSRSSSSTLTFRGRQGSLYDELRDNDDDNIIGRYRLSTPSFRSSNSSSSSSCGSERHTFFPFFSFRKSISEPAYN